MELSSILIAILGWTVAGLLGIGVSLYNSDYAKLQRRRKNRKRLNKYLYK